VDYVASTRGQTQGEPEELRSAFENVVRNALAYSPRGGHVSVRLDATRDRYEIRVADSGPGVPEEDLQRIFEPFYRTDASRDHRKSGEGIGLAITASVLHRHGGTATATNLAEGGLEIKLTLPLGEAEDS